MAITQLTGDVLSQYKKSNHIKFDLLMLLVKLDICPGIVYEGDTYPLNPSLYNLWFKKRRGLLL